ncbi:MAG: hypothetical protein AAFR46_02740 [Pseudomonadota bacterium]
MTRIVRWLIGCEVIVASLVEAWGAWWQKAAVARLKNFSQRLSK